MHAGVCTIVSALSLVSNSHPLAAYPNFCSRGVARKALDLVGLSEASRDCSCMQGLKAMPSYSMLLNEVKVVEIESN